MFYILKLPQLEL